MLKFSDEKNTIIFWDAIEALMEIDDNSIDLIFADPPYNIGKNFSGSIEKRPTDEEYLKRCYEWIDLCIKKLKDNGSFYVMTATQFMPFFDIYIQKKMTILSRIIWSYDSSWVQAKRYFWSMYEPILHCVKNPKDYVFNGEDILVEAKTWATRKLIDYRKKIPTPYNSKKIPWNVRDFPRVRYRMDEYENHPTQKPIVLLERIIKASSSENDIILDPFSWTFTTWYVANKLRRRSISIELQEEYIKIWLRRLWISDNYKWEKLIKEMKTYEKKAYDKSLSLFNE